MSAVSAVVTVESTNPGGGKDDFCDFEVLVLCMRKKKERKGENGAHILSRVVQVFVVK